jgi:fermentation-respiration switch protein FrsA (DUF1100 family)
LAFGKQKLRLVSMFVIALAVGAYLLFLVGLFVFQGSLLYHPDRSAPNHVLSGLAEMQPIMAESVDGLGLLSWFAKGQPKQPIVVYLQGNAGNIGSREHKVRPFLDVGFGVLLVGYRGFGINPGKPSEEGLYADARAALSILDEEDERERPLILYGESLGTAVATAMAAELASVGTPVAALILEAPFSSVTAAAGHHYPFVPVKWLLKDHFDQASRISKISAPVLVFHGDHDQTMPIHLGKALFDQALMPKQSKWFEGAGHNNLFDFGAAELSIKFIQQAISQTLEIK